MCECSDEVRKVFDDGFLICTECGVSCQQLDVKVFSYNHAPPVARRDYSRKARFMRLFMNLQGHQAVPENVLEKLPKHFTDPQDLAAYLKQHSELRKYRPKLPSIWYQLGHTWMPFSERETQMARFEFDKVREKVSYLVLLPVILKRVGREDMLCFCKPISANMKRKYAFILEANPHSS